MIKSLLLLPYSSAWRHEHQFAQSVLRWQGRNRTSAEIEPIRVVERVILFRTIKNFGGGTPRARRGWRMREIRHPRGLNLAPNFWWKCHGLAFILLSICKPRATCTCIWMIFCCHCLPCAKLRKEWNVWRDQTKSSKVASPCYGIDKIMHWLLPQQLIPETHPLYYD